MKLPLSNFELIHKSIIFMVADALDTIPAKVDIPNMSYDHKTKIFDFTVLYQDNTRQLTSDYKTVNKYYHRIFKKRADYIYS